MARMHTRRKGRSKSVRPSIKKAPDWCKRTAEEVEALIVKYARSGELPSKIGVILRDQHGVPLTKYITNKRISQILKEKNLYPSIPEDLGNLLRRAYNLSRHLEEHPKDLHSRRGLQLIEAKIHRLSKYYKRERVLPADWKYRRGDARLVIQ
ncbi:MAG: 30S ribosomal protein S15 [Candidatus Odinarchaeia archaeon]